MKETAKCYSKITENNFLGNQFSTTVITDIHAIVSIGCNSKNNEEGILNYKVSVKDKVESDLSPFFDEVTSFIHELVLDKKRVLIHCQGGINRSPIFLLAYLSRYEMSLQEAIALIKLKKGSVRFQDHYLQQVVHWLGENSASNRNKNHTKTYI